MTLARPLCHPRVQCKLEKGLKTSATERVTQPIIADHDMKYNSVGKEYLWCEDVFIQGIMSHISVCEVLQDVSHLIEVVETNTKRRSLWKKKFKVKAELQTNKRFLGM